AIRDDDPVVFCEPKALMFVSGPVAEGDYTVPLGKAALVREGADVSLVGFGRTVQTALRAAELLARDGVSADVLDLRSLQPLDEEAILATLGKTGRVVVVDEAPPRCGIASDVAALCVDKGFDLLNAPVRRVTAPTAPVPSSPVREDAYAPTLRRVHDRPEAAAAGPVPAAAVAGGGSVRRTAETPVTPAARALARRLGVEPARVPGTGPGGRVTREDVEAWAARRRALVPV